MSDFIGAAFEDRNLRLVAAHSPLEDIPHQRKVGDRINRFPPESLPTAAIGVDPVFGAKRRNRSHAARLSETGICRLYMLSRAVTLARDNRIIPVPLNC